MLVANRPETCADDNFVTAWEKIDGVADRISDFATAVIDEVNRVAAESSIQAAADWALSFEHLYKRLYKYPHLRSDLEKQFTERTDKSGLRSACDWFQTFELKYLRVGGTLLTVESHDQSVKQEADALAQKSERVVVEEVKAVKARGGDGKYCMAKAMQLAQAICAGVGVDLPTAGDVEDDKANIAAVVMRLTDAKWWRRQLRTVQARKLETAARELGAVCKRRGGYCSIMTLNRRFGQKARNRELLESLEAENNQGQVWTLAELADKGVSNPVNRRSELMTRLSGFQRWAEMKGGWVPAFITQTCPSRYHSHNRSGVRNEKWDGSTPRDAQAYLSDVWAKTRAAWDRAEILAFGMRVAEPHHDGCPHWHLLMWFPSHQVDKAMAIYRAYALEDEPPPPGRESVRFKVLFDEVAENATGYIAKYISKNIDGKTDSGDAWSSDVVKTALRTEAWAATWGIRQFQQVGGASVTVWREVRRLGEQPMDCRELEEIREAAHGGDWCGYTESMGGAVMRRAKRPLRAYMVRKMDEAGEFIKNAYGEFVRAYQGVEAFGWLPIRTRLYEWVVRPIKEAARAAKWAAQPPPSTA